MITTPKVLSPGHLTLNAQTPKVLNPGHLTLNPQTPKVLNLMEEDDRVEIQDYYTRHIVRPT
jgi:hypothetical protein